MLFNSWIFVGFLVVVFTVYYTIPKLGLNQNKQIFLLFFSSLVFYAYETPSLVFLLLFSLGMNCLISRAIVISSIRFGKSVKWLWIAVFANLLILIFFKYAYLITSLIIPDDFMINLKKDLASIPLPVGISFYTFQAISLLVDLNKRGVVGVKSLEDHFTQGKNNQGFLNIAFYIAFFPQLVAGPIVKAHDFFDQINLKHLRDVDWNIVISNVITGYFMKMVIADNLKDITYLLNTINLKDLGRWDLVALLYGYSFQIFADFAGYSLIAIGLGAMFGYKFPTNFNFPYISASVTEFWRRWHISLSSFLREYLYIPLGGNRKGTHRTYLNLFIVMFLGGLWHGAAWSYAIWGVSHGVLLAIEKLYSDLTKNSPAHSFSKLRHFVKILITFHIVSLLWLLFLMPEFSRVVEYFYLILTTQKTLLKMQHIYIVAIYSLPIILYHLAAYFREHPLTSKSHTRLYCINSQAFSLSLMLFLIILNTGTSGEFIYFQF
jgi:alginate O-acetyltransferase complex protein AlgI